MKTEILSPAGEYDSFLAALHNGANAVYLAAGQFGARAYAKNFSTDEIKQALRLAHLHQCRIYLTVNTLIKEKECQLLLDTVRPLVDAGLDAFIVQDLGAARLLHEAFPHVALHASTQMTVTDAYGVNALQKLGFSRVILSRELTLSEIQSIRKQTDLELEVFVHGAMCYAYSGQCLFSSCLGQRSANRGHCAGPCRLPYTAFHEAKPQYLLSLKDLMAIDVLPSLVTAGVSSFKIEGRMKPPSYVASVTGLYRKYLDRYLNHPKQPYQIEAADRLLLEQIYHRGKTRDGYLTKKKGPSMITLQSPAYQKASEDIIETANLSFLQNKKQLPVDMQIECIVNRPLSLTLSCQQVSVSVQGKPVLPAKKQPLSTQHLKKQFSKLGDTPFLANTVKAKIEGDGFLPISDLNETRRKGVLELEKALLAI